MEDVKVPTLDEIKDYLTGYGWKYRETTGGAGQVVLIAPCALANENKGVLMSFRIEGEFVMVSTVGFLKNISPSYSKRLLELNDKIKLVKLYVTHQNNPEMMDVDLGFELWSEAWSKGSFYSFMDMVAEGVEMVLEVTKTENIAHETDFVIFE